MIGVLLFMLLAFFPDLFTVLVDGPARWPIAGLLVLELVVNLSKTLKRSDDRGSGFLR